MLTIDEELRKNISFESYTQPDELISFLSEVYGTTRFENLKEISVKNKKYYFVLKDNDFYIREDYLSSGEYFVINLYKMIQRKCKCIVIDEIDISLDASAQVKLLKQLRLFCAQYEINIIFTTHSLALMKTLEESELYYMNNDNGNVIVEAKSYNFVKSLLFGFKGWDKYILTEDDVLERYIDFLLSQSQQAMFFKYKTIYIGGAPNVVDIMQRNRSEQFLSNPENVICILDGDQRFLRHTLNNDCVYCIPFESIEKALYEYYLLNDVAIPRITIDERNRRPAKYLFKTLIKERLMSENEIFIFLNNKMPIEVAEFKLHLLQLLNANQLN